MSVEKIVNELSVCMHDLAISKGWWPNGPSGRDPAEIVALFHSEISEAFEEYRRGRMETWYYAYDEAIGEQHIVIGEPDDPRIKPEGFWVEIADLLIRLFDTMGAYQWKYDNGAEAYIDTEIPKFIVEQHRRCSGMYDLMTDKANAEHANFFATSIIQASLGIAKANSVDLWHVIDLKHRHNETRAFRHGNKKA